MNNSWENNLIKIKPYVPGEQSNDSDIVKINANENPYPPSPKVIEAIKNFNSDDLRFYPNANGTALKKALAKHYGVGVENVFLGNGSDDVLALSFKAFFNSDKPILFPDLTYSFYPVWCSLFNIQYENPKVNEDFTINVNDYFVPNGGVVIPNPNAPTSIGEGEDFVTAIMDGNKASVVIIDEAYADFGEYSAVGLTKKYENLLIAGTFSKSRSLAGLRVGFAIGSSKLISCLEAVKNSYNSYTIDSLSLAVGVASVEDNKYFVSNVEKVKATRKRVSMQLKQMGFNVINSSANFILMNSDIVDAKSLFEFLKKEKIFVRYFNLPRLENHLRVTIGTDGEMNKFLDGVKKFLK